MKSMFAPVRKESDRVDMAGFSYSEAKARSMIRLCTLAALLAPLFVWADSATDSPPPMPPPSSGELTPPPPPPPSSGAPHFSTGGFTFQLQYGAGFWTVDTTKLGADPGKD